jgi:hypothetical protein
MRGDNGVRDASPNGRMNMAQFHKGQEVEVQCLECEGAPLWRKAKIFWPLQVGKGGVPRGKNWQVEFPDGSRAVFDAAHIRTSGPFKHEGLNDVLREHEAKRDFAGSKGENPSWE